MPETERRSSGSSYWVIVVAVIGVLLSVANGFWSIANPKGDIKELKDDFAGQLRTLRNDLDQFEKDVRWSYATKDFVGGKVDAIDRENTTYRRLTESTIGRIDAKVGSLDSEIHGVYSPKDQFTQLNARLIELERAARDSSKTVK